MDSLPADYRAADLSPDRLGDVLLVDTWAFPSSVSEEKLAELPMSLSWDRTRGVETTDGELVAM